MWRIGARCGCGHRVGVGRCKRFSKESSNGPLVGRDQRQHRFLQALVVCRRLFSQAQQQLAGRIRVVEGAVWPGLRKTHLDRKQREAVAGCGRQHDACDVQCVEDLLGRGPEAGRGQEVDVQTRSVANRLTTAKKFRQLAQRVLRACCTAELLRLDAGESKDCFRHRASWVDQSLEGAGDAIGGECDSADLDDTITGRVETSGLEVYSCVLRHGPLDSTCARRCPARRPLLKGHGLERRLLYLRAMQTGAIEAPKRLEDLHVRRDLVASLMLRTLAFSDQLSGAALETRLSLPFETLQPLIEEFQKTQLMDTLGFSNDPSVEGRPIPVRMNYTVSSAGRQRAAEMSAVQTRYLGPCPIAFDDYLALVRSQVTGKANVTDASLKKALGTLELEQHVIDQIGGAMVSRASLFIFGAPGNGKSTITERMALLMGAPVEIPHAVAVGDEIIRVIDPVYHKIADGAQPIDRRLGKVERPVVVAGGELKLVQLDLTYDASNRYYEAPLQWKANAGVFVIDDFGRQEVPPMRLLNRFIVPMEKKVDYLDLSASGRKIELPFLCQVVFSTNLSPTELVDEAFLRRMAYKIGVGNPSPEAFGRILPYECDRRGVLFDEKAIGYLLNNLNGKKPLRGSHPRALIARLVDLANYRQEPPRLTPQTLKEAFDACFNPALGSLTEDNWARPAIN